MGARPAEKDTGKKRDTGKKIRLDTSDFGKRNALKTRCLTEDRTRKGINGQPRIETNTCMNGRRYGRRKVRKTFQWYQGALHKIYDDV